MRRVDSILDRGEAQIRIVFEVDPMIGCQRRFAGAVCEGIADRAGRDEAQTANQGGLVGGETPGYRSRVRRGRDMDGARRGGFDRRREVGGEIVEGEASQVSGILPNPARVHGHDGEPCIRRGEKARQRWTIVRTPCALHPARGGGCPSSGSPTARTFNRSVSTIRPWALVVWLISLFGGWLQLSHDYLADRDFVGRRWWFQSAGFRFGTNYSGCLIVGANPTGIRFSILLPFRLAHPPLFIPWSELEIVRERSWFIPIARLRTHRHPSVTITITQRLLEKIETELGRSVEGRAAA